MKNKTSKMLSLLMEDTSFLIDVINECKFSPSFVEKPMRGFDSLVDFANYWEYHLLAMHREESSEPEFSRMVNFLLDDISSFIVLIDENKFFSPFVEKAVGHFSSLVDFANYWEQHLPQLKKENS